jgi:hypothetical protein
MTNDKQVFANAICPIEFTCRCLVSCVVIYYYCVVELVEEMNTNVIGVVINKEACRL